MTLARVANTLEDNLSPELSSAFMSFVYQPECKRLLNRLISEQFRLEFKTVSILSMYPNEGRSMLTAALAFGYASMLNGRVLVVSGHDSKESTAIFSFLHLHAEAVGLTSGALDFLNARDTSRFSSEFELSSYVQSVRDHYDVVLIDTAPLVNESSNAFDAVVLSSFFDASVVLLSNKSMQRDAMRYLQKVLKRNELNVLGTIFNQFRA